MSLFLYNTLTRRKDAFKPIDENNVRMYVCGPTVYDRPHLGNARSVVVYDVLYRLLMHLYGEKHVTYVRNITDVDDKINAAAKEKGEPISALTQRVEGWFHDDMGALNVLPATLCRTLACESGEGIERSLSLPGGALGRGYMFEPHATHHIPHMIKLIESLLAHKKAYVAQGHVLFDVTSYSEYGALSGRKLDDLIAGARVEVGSYKKHPGDFVLWKPGDEGDDASSVFESPWGKGRPGWHIECSAMSSTYLGENFDIHGGGVDLMFPHHENEIAQSRCALPGSTFANYWVHNGFLTVGGEKMSKSLGNFTTVKDLLDKGIKGEVIRFALLSSKYNEPLDWNEKLVHDAKITLDKWYRILERYPDSASRHSRESGNLEGITAFIDALSDDLNLPKAVSLMHGAKADDLLVMANILGLLQQKSGRWFRDPQTGVGVRNVVNDSLSGHPSSESIAIEHQINARIAAKKAKNWAEADRIRKELSDQGIVLEDRPDGTTDWRRA